jgi:hypothetical protein
MQVGLATERPSTDARFQDASYGFTVFSIMAPVIVVGVMIVLFLLPFGINFVAMVVYLNNRKRGMGRSKSKGES